MNRFPEIETVFDLPCNSPNKLLYNEVIRNILKNILPKEVVQSEATFNKKQFLDVLPLITSSTLEQDVADVSFYCVVRHRLGVFKFFYEMLINWLIPGEPLSVNMLYAVDFKIPEIGDDIYTLCEVMVKIQDNRQLLMLRRNLPAIFSELRLGVESSYHARRILEVKGLSADVKTAMIQEHIIHVMNRAPQAIDRDVLTEMQHLLVLCRDEFKAARSAKHLSRIIITQHLFRKEITKCLTIQKDRRYVALKVFRSEIRNHDETKHVLSLVIGINFSKDKEIFNQTHLVKALQACLPEAKPIVSSFISSRRGNESFCSFYIEIEKEAGVKFTSDEIMKLRNFLPQELKSQVGVVMNPIFMPRNEEEIMRYILILSSQIKFIRDIPQLYIQFDEQSPSDLYFTIIAVRVVSPGCSSIEVMFKKTPTQLEYIHDRCKSVGVLRKKYAKEVTVFRVKLPKEPFFRKDHTIDLYKARQEVVYQLVRVIGEFRDYNGGMISKQTEILEQVKKKFTNLTAFQEDQIDRLFHSIEPPVMRTLFPPNILKTIYDYLFSNDGLPQKLDGDVKLEIKQTPAFLLVMIQSENLAKKEKIDTLLEEMNRSSIDISQFQLERESSVFWGYIYRSDDPLKQWKVQQLIRNTLNSRESFGVLDHSLLVYRNK